MTPDDLIRGVRESALGMLARREHSVFELTQKLSAKGHARRDIETVLERLRDAGLQSDGRFAESFVRSRLGRGLGLARIKAELKQRGVAPDLIQGALAACEADWLAQCADVARRRFGSAPPKDAKERARRARFLQYRGFSPAQISRVLRGGVDDEVDATMDDDV